MNGESKQLLDAFKQLILSLHAENKEDSSLLRKDVKSIFKILNNLPCDERKGLYGSIQKQLGWHWFLLGAIIWGFIGMAVK